MTPDQLRNLAADARNKSYSPYSGFAVGAALKLKGIDQPVLGTNVENASYGGTICAERSAIVAAIAQYGKVEFEALAVVAVCDPPVVPCAFCLGVIAEFCGSDFPIYSCSPEKVEKVYRLGDLLPNPFKLDHP